MSLRRNIIQDLEAMEADLEQPTFTWQGNNYTFIPSITLFNRELEMGGFQLVRLLSATVRMYSVDCDNNYTAIFATLPQPQQKFTYMLDNTVYRIESIKLDPTNSYFRMVAHSTTVGVGGNK